MDLPKRIYHGPEVDRLYRDLLAADAGGSASGDAGGDLSGTYPDPTVVKLQGRSVDSTAPSTNDALVWNGTAWVPTAVVLSGNTLSQYLADIPPTSPHADDDEFDDGSVSWGTAWDHGTVSPTVVEGDAGLDISYTGNGGHRWVGRYKAVPSSEFAFISRMQSSGMSDNLGGTRAALLLFEDPTSATGDFYALELSFAANVNNGASVVSRRWAAYNTSSGLAQTTSHNTTLTSVYARFRMFGTTVSADYSSDGRAFRELSTVTLPFTPSHYGLGCGVFGSGSTGHATFRFVRVWSGTGTYAYNASAVGEWRSILYV